MLHADSLKVLNVPNHNIRNVPKAHILVMEMLLFKVLCFTLGEHLKFGCFALHLRCFKIVPTRELLIFWVYFAEDFHICIWNAQHSLYNFNRIILCILSTTQKTFGMCRELSHVVLYWRLTNVCTWVWLGLMQMFPELIKNMFYFTCLNYINNISGV